MTSQKKIERFAAHSHTFSFNYALIELLNSLDYKYAEKRSKPLSPSLHNVRHRYVFSWLRRFLSRFPAEKLNEEGERQVGNSSVEKNTVIWTCWMDGEKEAPPLVRECFTQMRKHAGRHPVVIIDKTNFRQYCPLPDFILRKYDQGIISVQQLTDILRVRLLSLYGGLWLDSTILLVSDIPDWVFAVPTFSVKGLNPRFFGKPLMPDATGWASYALGGMQSAFTALFIYDCLLDYWKHMDTQIDYFLIFYLASICRTDTARGKEEYDLLPDNNSECEILSAELLSEQPRQAVLDRCVSSSTWAYKLNWKVRYAQDPMRVFDSIAREGALAQSEAR